MNNSDLCRFEKKTVRKDGCWSWSGWRSKYGYGMFKLGGKDLVASRVSYEIHKGKIPDGLEVCHKCDNPECTNPDHLFLGTHRENMEDAKRKGRIVFHVGERNGRCRLNAEQVRSIFNRIANGEMQIDLAKEYVVSRQAITAIWGGKTWQHLNLRKAVKETTGT